MAEAGVIFPRGDAERIRRTVKAHEGQPTNSVGPRQPFRRRRAAYVTFRVKVKQSGGSNGNATTAPTYTYHIYRAFDTTDDAANKLNNASSGAAVSPEKSRPNGKVTAATIGLAYYDNTGEIKLYEAHEKPGAVEACT